MKQILFPDSMKIVGVVPTGQGFMTFHTNGVITEERNGCSVDPEFSQVEAAITCVVPSKWGILIGTETGDIWLLSPEKVFLKTAIKGGDGLGSVKMIISGKRALFVRYENGGWLYQLPSDFSTQVGRLDDECYQYAVPFLGQWAEIGGFYPSGKQLILMETYKGGGLSEINRFRSGDGAMMEQQYIKEELTALVMYNSHFLITGSAKPAAITIWRRALRARRFKQLIVYPKIEPITHLVLSPSKELLAIGRENGLVSIGKLNPAAGGLYLDAEAFLSPIQNYPTEQQNIRQLVFSPDGEMLYVLKDDNSVTEITL